MNKPARGEGKTNCRWEGKLIVADHSVKRAFGSQKFDTRIVHPLTTRQYRLPADPGNKTDDTDLCAIHRATTNGFGLIELPLDEIHGPLRLLARYRRSLVRKNAVLRNQIIELLDVLLPGYTGLFNDVFDNQAALSIARSVKSASEVRTLGSEGLAQILTITGRAGIYPSRYQSDKVDRSDGPLVRRANRKLRGVIMMIADNLLACNRFFKALKKQWVATGMEEQAMCVRVAKRFCRIAYQMVAGGQVFRHPSCRKRDYILRKLSIFHAEHGSSMAQVITDLQAATDHIPTSEHAPEAKRLYEELQPSNRRQQSGPRRLGEILPVVLAKLGVNAVDLSLKGENDLT